MRVGGIATAKPTKNQGLTHNNPGDAQRVGEVMSNKLVLNTSWISGGGAALVLECENELGLRE